MSVIQSIRDKGAWIIFGIIALALIAFILQDSSFRSGHLFTNTTTVGKINGEKIERADFDAKIDFIQQMNGTQNADRDQLISGVWDLMLNETLLNQEVKKLGLAFTPKELNDVLFGNNPPQWLQQAFTDPNTGQFNADAAKQQFAQMKKTPNDPRVAQIYQAYIQPTIEQSLSQKYTAMISGAVYIPKWFADKTNADNNLIASASYVVVPYSSISDSAFKITDDEINTYVQKHQKQFEQKEETRTISYVNFDASPSKQDSEAVLNQVNSLKQQFAATDTSSVKSFLSTKGSAIPYDESYVTQKNLKPPFADSILRLADGQVFGPYVDQQNYVIAKMMGRRMMPDSVKVRHILIKTEDKSQPVLPDSIANKRIDSIAAAIQHGANFDSMVQKYSDDAGSKATHGEYTFSSTQFSGISKEFAEVAFYGKTGDKKIVKVSNQAYGGYHYIEVLEQKNMQPAYNIAYLAKPIVASAETINAANTAADQFAATTHNSKDFSENAAKLKMQVLPSPAIKENDFTVGSLGNTRELVKWAYQHKVGDISEPFSVQDGKYYIVAILASINKKGQPSAETVRSTVEKILINEKKAKQIIATKLKGSTLEAVAQSAGTTVQKADSISFAQPFIPNIGNEPKVVGAAFNKSLQNKISAPMAGNSGVFVLQGANISAKASFESDVSKELEYQLRSQISQASLTALRNAADIEDDRSTFY
ncbi:MAG: peptidylprolyl isomerase [Chitinophagaceae bacterium]